MKKICISLLLLCAAVAQAQNDVTTFLGIPVDGSKIIMREELIFKGFTPRNSGSDEVFCGEFNGQNVAISIETNNNLVYRLAVTETTPLDEIGVISRFNTLYHQFEINQRYIWSSGNSISSREKISYKMLVYNKVYTAAFYQNGNPSKLVWFRISVYHGQYFITIYYDNLNNQANGEDL